MKSLVAKDWEDDGYGVSVKDQGQCGDCYAFSAIGALEMAYKIKNSDTSTDVDYSE